jgi:putative tryptophan/tyrosine transport system substrate-binding protein
MAHVNTSASRSQGLNRRAFTAGALALAASPVAVRAQQQRQVPRIAYLSANPAGDFRSQAFREGLREAGYTEGKDIVIEYFLAPTLADLPQWAAKAVSSKPDLIVAITTEGAHAAKAETTTIPIVFAPPADPVAQGLVASLARPGGNLTGTSNMVPEMAAKRLQILSEFVPGIARAAALYNFDNLAAPFSLDEIIRAGKLLSIDVRAVGVRAVADLVPAISSAVSDGAQAIYIVGNALFANSAQLVAGEALKHRLPSISDTRIHPDAGGLLSYGANLPERYRRVGYYVDRILKGAKPADLPVELPTVFDLVINRKTADALGLKIPESLLVLATEVIE